MRVAINGIGVAGPTLAYWLRRFGHAPVLFEESAVVRTGGFLIDFWGLG
jgi:2-polyprenyl-6-methoxyphenol hydroxylase-like FAD-dependent oxidoreductase